MQLNNALAREDALLREKSDLLQRQDMMAQEFEHRLFNSFTNSVKYAKGNITVRLGTTAADVHSLSVSDDGPGVPTEFDATGGSGLGMKIIKSLAKQIGGELHIARADHGRGACFTVTFNCPKS